MKYYNKSSIFEIHKTKLMKYQEISFEVNAPIDFVFDYLSLHENFEKINVASSLYESEFLDKELIQNGGSVKPGIVYNLKVQTKDLAFHLGCLTLAVEKNKLIKYRYVYNDVLDATLSEAIKSSILEHLNATPFEGSWSFKDLGNRKTQLTVLMEINGPMNFFEKIYHWVTSKSSSKHKKETIRLFQEIIAQIEEGF